MFSSFVNRIASVILIFSISIQGLAQSSTFSSLSKKDESKIDKLCSQFNSNESPGIAVMIFNNGELAYHKDFGMANVTEQIPVSSKTRFALSDLSAHFTAFATLMLEERGLLLFDNLISEYLPNIPENLKSVKVKDLIQHSSGIDQYYRLKYYAGWRSNDIVSHTDALDLISVQEKLLFSPGSEVHYSESNLVLLAEIISVVSKKTFDVFMKEEIFEPLGMTNSLIAIDINQIIKNMAIPYEVDDDMLKYEPINTSVLGANNMYSTTEDLIKWEMNLYSSNPKLVSKEVIEKMNTVIELEYNGKIIKPYDGTTYGQIGYHPERGGYKSYMSGTNGGFTCCTTKIIDKGVTAFVLSNSSESSTINSISITSALDLHPSLFPLPKEIDYSTIQTLKLTSEELGKYTGYYWNASEGFSRVFTVENDTLRYGRTTGLTSALIPISKDKFQMIIPGSDIKLTMRFDFQNDKKRIYSKQSYYTELLFEEFTPEKSNQVELKDYIGTYINKQLGTVYNLYVNEDKVILEDKRQREIELIYVMDDTFSSNTYYFRNVSFERSSQSSISGMYINNKGKKNIFLARFNKE